VKTRVLTEMNLPSLQTKFKAKHFKETLGIIQNNNEKWKKAKDENLALTCKKTSQVSSLFFVQYIFIIFSECVSKVI